MSETYAGQDNTYGVFSHSETPKDRRLSAAAYAIMFELAVINPEGPEAKFLSTARKDGWIVEEVSPPGQSISDIRPQLIEGYEGRPDQNES